MYLLIIKTQETQCLPSLYDVIVIYVIRGSMTGKNENILRIFPWFEGFIEGRGPEIKPESQEKFEICLSFPEYFLRMQVSNFPFHVRKKPVWWENILPFLGMGYYNNEKSNDGKFFPIIPWWENHFSWTSIIKKYTSSESDHKKE